MRVCVCGALTFRTTIARQTGMEMYADKNEQRKKRNRTTDMQKVLLLASVRPIFQA